MEKYSETSIEDTLKESKHSNRGQPRNPPKEDNLSTKGWSHMCALFWSQCVLYLEVLMYIGYTDSESYLKLLHLSGNKTTVFH